MLANQAVLISGPNLIDWSGFSKLVVNCLSSYGQLLKTIYADDLNLASFLRRLNLNRLS